MSFIINLIGCVGYHGRNVKFITQKARVELIKLFKKDFKINVIVKKRNEKLRNQPAGGQEEILSKDYAINEAKEEIARLKKENKSKFKKSAKLLISKIEKK